MRILSPHRRTFIKAAVVGLVAAAGVASMAVPSQAATQEWNSSAAYRASRDFIAAHSSVSIGGRGCGGEDATSFYVQLVRTSDTHLMLTTSRRSVNDSWYNNIDSHQVSAGTAYYVRWYGRMPDPTGGVKAANAGCQGVQYVP